MRHNNIYNKIFVSVLILSFVFNNFFFLVPTAQAEINKQINYQGKLTDSSNVPVADGEYEMEFNLYTQPTDGSAIWTETLSGADEVQVTNGLFSVMLGSTTPFTGVDFNQTLYLGVNIEGDGEMTPRKIIGAVPASFVADTVDNLSSEQFLRSDAQNATSSTDTFISVLQSGAGKVAEFFGQASASVLSILSDGNVGIGTTTPYARLSVAGSAVVTGSLTTSSITSTSTATSTFEGGIEVDLLNVTSTTASSTFANGINLSAGCFAINGTCITGGGSGGGSGLSFDYPFTNNSTSTLLSFVGGLISSASTTIGAGTQTGGLTIFGGATTTGNAYFAGNIGIGTTTPYAQLSIAGSAGQATTSSLLSIASSTTSLAPYVSISARGVSTFNGSGVDPQFVSETYGPTPGTSLNGVRDIFVSGKYAYTANLVRSSLAVIDISNPSSPTFIAETLGPTPGTSLNGARGLYVSGKYAYVVTSNRDSLAVIDISNPSSPTFIAETQGPIPGTSLDGAIGVFVSGKYAYVASENRDSLAVIDISNPSSPTFIAETQGPIPGTSLNGAREVFVSGKYAYVVAFRRDSLAVIDISNPSSPTFIAETQGPTPNTSLDGPRDLYVSGKYAYVTNNFRDSLSIIDISNPASPTFVAETQGPTPGTSLNAASGVFVSGKYAYVTAENRDSLAVIDISNPSSPTFIAETQGPTPGTSLNGAGAVFVSGRYAYVINLDGDSMAIIDIGGVDTSTLQAGSVGTDNLQVSTYAQFGQSVNIEGGLGVGVGGLYSQGGIFSYVSSSTASNLVSAAFIGGNVGIGTTSPYERLSVNGNGVIDGYVRASSFIATSTTASIFPYASSTAITTGTFWGANLSNCTTGNKLTWADGSFSCDIDLTGGGSGGGSWSTTTSQVADQIINYSNGSTDIIAIGSNATTSAEYWFDPVARTAYLGGNVGVGTTSPYAKLSVAGDGVITGSLTTSSINATSSATSTFAGGLETNLLNITSTTASSTFANGISLSAGCFAINNTCLANNTYGNTDVNAFIHASTTIPKTYTINTFTNTNAWDGNSFFNGDVTIGSLDGPLYANDGVVGATTTISVAYGGTGQSSFTQGWLHSDGTTITSSTSPTVAYLTATSTATSSFAGPIINTSTATSTWANGINLSSGCFAVNNTCLANSTYGDTNVNAYIHASSTIPKTYTANTFTNSNIFSGASTFNSTLTVGSLNGPLQANNGVVSATTSVGVVYGGTGLTTAPTYGQLLVGNSSGGYTLTATSSLGLLTFAYPFTNNSTSTLLTFSGGLISSASTTIGDGTQTGGLTISGGVTTTGNAYFAGNVGIGVSGNPASRLQVRGSSASDGITINNAVGVGSMTLSSASYGFAPDSSINNVFRIFNNNNDIVPILNIDSAAGTTRNSTTTIGGSLLVNATQDTPSIFNISNNSGLSILRVNSTSAGGNVGIGTTSPYERLSVGGNAVVTGSITTSSITATSTATSTFAGGIQTNLLNVTSTTASSTFANGINLAAGCFAINGVCLVNNAYGDESVNAYIHASTTIPKTYTANTFTGSQTFNGAATFNEAVTFNTLGAITFNGAIDNAGTATSSWANGLDIADGCFAVDGICIGQNVQDGSEGQVAYYSADGQLISGTSSLFIDSNGNIGIGTTTPGTLLSIGDTDGINFTTATSTFNSEGGINLTSGCFAINGTCITGGEGGGGGGSGTVEAGTTGQFGYYAGDGTTLSSTSTIFLTTSGTLGIGTTSVMANAKLLVDGGLGISSPNGAVFLGNTTGDARGIESLELQVARSLSTQVASGLRSIAIGHSNTAAASDAIAIGSSNAVSTNSAIAIGSGNLISTMDEGIAIGSLNEVSGETGIAFGYANTATGTLSGVFGINSSAKADGAFAFGGNINNTTANSLMIGPSDSSKLTILSSGNVGIGTTSPYAKLSVSGAIVGEYFQATSTTATSSIAGGLNVGQGNLVYDFTTGITSVNTLQTGNLNFDVDAGMVSWADLTLSSASVDTPQGYTAFLNGSSTISVYGVSAGSGWLQSDYPRVSIGEKSDGISTPTSKLTIFSNGTSTNGAFEIVDNASTTLMKVLDNGRTGFATTSPWRTLSVNGTVGFQGITNDGSGNYVCLSGSNEITYSTTACAGLSTSKVKYDINPLGSALSQVNALNPVSYKYNLDVSPNDQSTHLGFIAEEVNAINPNLVVFDAAGLPKSVKYDEFTPLLAKAIQEQQLQINTLSSTTETLAMKDNQKLATSTDETLSFIEILNTNLASTTQTTQTLASAIDLTNTQVLNLGSRLDKLNSFASTTESMKVQIDEINLKFENLSIDILASSTADILASSTPGFIERIASAVKELISGAGEWMVAKISATLAIFDKVETSTLCVGETCVTEAELKALLKRAKIDPVKKNASSTIEVIEEDDEEESKPNENKETEVKETPTPQPEVVVGDDDGNGDTSSTTPDVDPEDNGGNNDNAGGNTTPNSGSTPSPESSSPEPEPTSTGEDNPTQNSSDDVTPAHGPEGDAGDTAGDDGENVEPEDEKKVAEEKGEENNDTQEGGDDVGSDLGDGGAPEEA